MWRKQSLPKSRTQCLIGILSKRALTHYLRTIVLIFYHQLYKMLEQVVTGRTRPTVLVEGKTVPAILAPDQLCKALRLQKRRERLVHTTLFNHVGNRFACGSPIAQFLILFCWQLLLWQNISTIVLIVC